MKFLHDNWVFRPEVLLILILTWSYKVCGKSLPEDPDAPRFITRGETSRIVRGDILVLPCEVDNLGEFVIVWKRGIAVLTAGTAIVSRDKRLRLVDGFNLEIRNVQPQDAGDYACQIATSSPVEQVHTVEILVPPNVKSISAPDGQIVVQKGTSTTLECRSSGNPVPTITWTRKNNLLPNGEKSVEGSSISIENADRHQAGLYECTADNGVGDSVTAEIQLQVLYSPDIEVERSWVHSGEGYEAELVCIVHAEPESNVMWYRETLLLDTTERRLMESRGNRHTLVIRNVEPSDFGNYSCQAYNTYGRERKYLELSGRPNPAVFRSDPVGRLRDSYNITWAVESYTPIEEYRLQYRKLHLNGSWESAGAWNDVVLPSVPIQGTFVHVKSYDIRFLEPDTLYEAKIQSRNKYGWSEESPLFQFSTRVDDYSRYEPSSDSEVLEEPEVRDLGMTAAAASDATAITVTFLTLFSSILLFVTS